MRKPTFILLPTLLLAACGDQSSHVARTSAEATSGSAYPGFNNYLFLPANYTGETFVLSKDYPKEEPKTKLPAFFSTDFRKDWRTYLLQVRDYCFEGNTEVDFRVEKNSVRSWYHMPWQAYGPLGREGIHGLTKEAPFQSFQLCPTQSFAYAGAWAVGFYNAPGGYTIGQVWKNPNQPDLSLTTAPARGFPEGTVLFKLLFASFPADTVAQQVPYLSNPLQWQAYVEPKYTSDTPPPPQPIPRTIMPVTLIQMDIMVKDSRATETGGWVFGNYQYNGALSGKAAYENLAPLGLLWGNDPSVTGNDYTNPKPVKTRINPTLTQTVINPDTNELPVAHLGWNGRLNGPADNPQSSCYSCHMTAQYPPALANPTFQEASKIPPVGSPKWMKWFQNVPCGTVFDSTQVNAKACDNSLQLAGAVSNFNDWLQSTSASNALGAPANDNAPQKHRILRAPQSP